MTDSIKLSSVALDCPDAGKLAAFYADITGGKVTFLHEAWATVNGPGGSTSRPSPATCRRPGPTQPRRHKCTWTSMSTWTRPRRAC
jgi:hypothetical protein